MVAVVCDEWNPIKQGRSRNLGVPDGNLMSITVRSVGCCGPLMTQRRIEGIDDVVAVNMRFHRVTTPRRPVALKRPPVEFR